MALAVAPVAIIAAASLVGWIVWRLTTSRVDVHLHDTYFVVVDSVDATAFLLTVVCATAFVGRRHGYWSVWLTAALGCVVAHGLVVAWLNVDPFFGLTYYRPYSDRYESPAHVAAQYLVALYALAEAFTAVAFIRTFRYAFSTCHWNNAPENRLASMATFVIGTVLALALAYLWLPWSLLIWNARLTSSISVPLIVWAQTAVYLIAPVIATWRLTRASRARFMAVGWRGLHVLFGVAFALTLAYSERVGSFSAALVATPLLSAVQVFFVSGALAVWIAQRREPA
jgi:hypothetical protein